MAELRLATARHLAAHDDDERTAVYLCGSLDDHWRKRRGCALRLVLVALHAIEDVSRFFPADQTFSQRLSSVWQAIR